MTRAKWTDHPPRQRGSAPPAKPPTLEQEAGRLAHRCRRLGSAHHMEVADMIARLLVALDEAKREATSARYEADVLRARLEVRGSR